MNIVLWVAQMLLSAQFLFHGLLFVSPPPELPDILNATFPVWFRLSLGVAELLAAVGLILPGVTRLLPWLVPLAALGLMLVTVSATAFYFARGEVMSALMTLLLLILATFVAYLRWRVKPIAPGQVSQTAS